jgi:hypothetical protein
MPQWQFGDLSWSCGISVCLICHYIFAPLSVITQYWKCEKTVLELPMKNARSLDRQCLKFGLTVLEVLMDNAESVNKQC